jgi:uncharacterized protein
MESRGVFIDTSGFYSLLVSNDIYHQTARRFVRFAQKSQLRAVTTDYVLDETFTLLKARKVDKQIPLLLEIIENSSFLTVHWVDEEIFLKASKFLLRYGDHAYSFTDCVSFVVMNKLKMQTALTTDKHFKEAGFTCLV